MKKSEVCVEKSFLEHAQSDVKDCNEIGVTSRYMRSGNEGNQSRFNPVKPVPI